MFDHITNKRIIIAPLCWGLGHATRCIPIIQQLSQNNTVAIASDGEALTLLKEEFPDVEAFELPSYDIRYAYDSMIANMLVQGPGSIRTIKREKKKANEIAENWKADLIISDNRFGFRSKQTENVYITHQLNIPTNNPLLSNLASRVHHRIINKFDQCWVPDYKGQNNLAGKLSQVNVKIPTTYLGPLSRMEKKEVQNRFDFTAVLSGPEPQRTKLERILSDVFSTFPSLKFCLVRGTREKEQKTQIPNVETHDLLSSRPLNEIMNASRNIICRSGYTSIMDLIKLEKPAILIPTPGQYEQEYLAKRLDGKHDFRICDQKNIKSFLSNAFQEE